MFSLFKRKSEPSAEEQRLLLQHVRDIDILENLSQEQIRGLIPAFRFKVTRNEDVACHCPDATHDAFILLKGTVAVTRDHQEDRHVVDLATPGDVFNVGVLMGAKYDYVASRALAEVEVMALDTKMLVNIAKVDPQIGYKVLRSFGRLMSEQMARQLEHLLHPTM